MVCSVLYSSSVIVTMLVMLDAIFVSFILQSLVVCRQKRVRTTEVTCTDLRPSERDEYIGASSQKSLQVLSGDLHMPPARRPHVFHPDFYRW